MSLATLRKSLINDIPNISRFGMTINVNINASNQKCLNSIIEFEGRTYSVPMFYVVHTECGKRIRVLFQRGAYNETNSSLDRSRLRPVLVFCPKCGAMAGKHARRQLQAQGRLYGFYNPPVDLLISNRNFTKNFIAANYIFPRGVGYNLQGEITSVDQKWAARCRDDDEILDDDEVEDEVCEAPTYHDGGF